MTEIELHEDWEKWRKVGDIEILRPEENWEGGDIEAKPSVRGEVIMPVNEVVVD